MNIRELHSALSGKLKLEALENKRHTGFRVVLDGGVIPLPTVVRLSRGNGDVPNGNVVGVAKSLGLSEFEVRKMVACSIDRKCVTLCMVGCLIEGAAETRRREGLVYAPGVSAMLDSVDRMLEAVCKLGTVRWRPEETKALRRVDARLGSILTDEQDEIAARISQLRAALCLPPEDSGQLVE